MKLFGNVFPRCGAFAGRRAVLTGGKALGGIIAGVLVLGGGVMGAALPANAAAGGGSPAARLAAEATPQQNRAIDSAMSAVPGGTRVSPGEVTWHQGRVTLWVGAAADDNSAAPDCLSDTFCAWNGTDYQGSGMTPCMVQLQDPQWYDWSQNSFESCGSLGTWSWANKTPDRVWRIQYYNGSGGGSGNKWCISPGDANPDVTDVASRTAGWIQITSTASAC